MPLTQDTLLLRLKARRRYILALVDAVLVAVALALGYFIIGLDVSRWDLRYAVQFRALLPLVIVVQVALFGAFHLYRGLLRYAGAAELRAILLATAVTTAGLFGLYHFAPDIPRLWLDWPVEDKGPDAHILAVPRSVSVTYALLTVMLVGGFRFSRRLVLMTFRRRSGRRVILIGVDAGERAAREMLDRPEEGHDPVGFVDPDPFKLNRRVHGLRVMGRLDDLPRVIRETEAEEVVIALPDLTGGQIKEIFDVCRSADVEARILPSVSGILRGKVSVSAIRPVTIEDILGRDPVRLELPPGLNYLAGARILVTGAGGSIGSELVRQILPFEPESVVLLGRGENSLFDLATELGAGFDDARLPLVIADTRDESRMRRVFERHRPQIVFHAAAHKHVPFMELHPEEAVKNNVFGTRTVARLAGETGVERFILISTDKAVRPTSVMGATKRVAELLVWAEAVRCETRFMAVRFGNVLGSRGSLIPTLKRQIERGGPVTLTHRDMTRYFMTIPEAASLVVQAGALGDSGPLFVLDMGEPVKIADLINNLITLSGFRPGHEIEIEEIGPRPGEKIFEELLTADESAKATRFGKIFMTRPDPVDPAALDTALARLAEAAEQGDADAIRARIRELVPDYRPPSPPNH